MRTTPLPQKCCLTMLAGCGHACRQLAAKSDGAAADSAPPGKLQPKADQTKLGKDRNWATGKIQRGTLKSSMPNQVGEVRSPGGVDGIMDALVGRGETHPRRRLVLIAGANRRPGCRLFAASFDPWSRMR